MTGQATRMTANGLTDELLLARFVKGDRDALGALAERHETHLLGLARGLLNGRSDLARDAVQETWVRVIRYGASFDQRSTVRTWIYRIVINQCKNIRRARQSQEPIAASRTPVAARAGSTDPGDRDSPPMEALRAAVSRLDRNKSDIILLCYHSGMTHETAAEILRIPVGTLKSRLHAALKELREALTPEAIP